MSDIRVGTLTPGDGLGEHLGDIARLRVEVFRDWPYLYDGDAASEREYLAEFAASPAAVCVAAFDGAEMIGASTALPLTDEHDEFQEPFRAAGMDVERIFYCAESVLLPGYRGGGLYRQFFAGREAHARRIGGFGRIAFCGVIRPDDHPAKPADYRPLDPVWRHFGYEPRPDLVCEFPWLDIGDERQTTKPLMFWLKEL